MRQKSLVFIILLVLLLLMCGHRFDEANFVAKATMTENDENEDSASGPIISIQDEINNIHMDIPAGWSLISLPLIPDDASVSSLFPRARVVYGCKKGVGYVRVKKLEGGRGYWILSNKKESYPVSGRLIKGYNWAGNEYKWELIGGCARRARVSVYNGSVEVIYRYLQGIGYNRVRDWEKLNPGEGYWIHLGNITDQTELRIYGICDICYFTNIYKSAWSLVRIDLSAYKTAPVLISFRLLADGLNQADGWTIDCPTLVMPYFSH